MPTDYSNYKDFLRAWGMDKVNLSYLPAPVLSLNERLLQAVKNEDLKEVTHLLPLEIDINFKNSEGESPLSLALHRDNLDLITLLIHKGADVQTIDCTGYTPLYWASENGHKELASILLDKGADINTPKGKTTPLMAAADHDHTELAILLITRGANVNALGPLKKAALHYAVRNGNKALTQALLDNGADVECINGDIAGGSLLLAINYMFNHPVMSFINHNYIRYVENAIALAQRADVNAVSFLKGRHYYSQVLTPLLLAARKGNVVLINTLIERGALLESQDENGNTPLLIAIKERNLNSARSLVTSGANVLVSNHAGETPLQLAAGALSELVPDLYVALADGEPSLRPTKKPS